MLCVLDFAFLFLEGLGMTTNMDSTSDVDFRRGLAVLFSLLDGSHLD